MSQWQEQGEKSCKAFVHHLIGAVNVVNSLKRFGWNYHNDEYACGTVVCLIDVTTRYLSQGWVTHGHTYTIASRLTRWHKAPTHKHTHTHTQFVQTYTSKHGGSSFLLLWAEAIIIIFIIITFCNTIPCHITSGLAAVWHSTIWCVCVSAYVSVNEGMFESCSDITGWICVRRRAGVEEKDGEAPLIKTEDRVHSWSKDRVLVI